MNIEILDRATDDLVEGFHYTLSSDTVYIHAVVDCRRNPRWIRKHVE